MQPFIKQSMILFTNLLNKELNEINNIEILSTFCDNILMKVVMMSNFFKLRIVPLSFKLFHYLALSIYLFLFLYECYCYPSSCCCYCYCYCYSCTPPPAPATPPPVCLLVLLQYLPAATPACFIAT